MATPLDETSELEDWDQWMSDVLIPIAVMLLCACGVAWVWEKVTFQERCEK